MLKSKLMSQFVNDYTPIISGAGPVRASWSFPAAGTPASQLEDDTAAKSQQVGRHCWRSGGTIGPQRRDVVPKRVIKIPAPSKDNVYAYGAVRVPHGHAREKCSNSFQSATDVRSRHIWPHNDYNNYICLVRIKAPRTAFFLPPIRQAISVAVTRG
jgi:hypothetical protein